MITREAFTKWGNRLAAAGGLLFIVLLQVGHEAVAGGGEMPALDAPVREYTAYISDTFGTTSYYVGQVMGWIGFGFLLLFMFSLSRTLRAAEDETPGLLRLAFGGGVVAVLFMLAAGAPQFAVAIRFDEGLDPVTAATLFNAGEVFFMLAWLPLGISVGAFGAQILQTRALPRWLGVFTCVVAVALLGFPAALPSDAGYMGFGLFLLWTIVASIVLVVREIRHPARASGAIATSLGRPATSER
jgi:hypothetical protein